jgi:hypothetical protein
VSTTTNRRPFHSVSPYSGPRVVRARSSTIAVREPTIAVEERALADVRAADDRDDREGAAQPVVAGRAGGRPIRPRRRRVGRRRAGGTWCGRPGSRRGQGGRGERRGGGRLGRAGELEDAAVTSRRSSIGRRRAAGHADDARASNGAGRSGR